ncbi:SurA N-terminal domain-containing protein [Desulfovibrio piger]|nr:SurA N-terminal domain-containing protein [Desulfovibrio piger]
MKHAFLALLMTLCMIAGAQAAQVNKVAAVVNGKVITMYDLQKTALPDLIRARINPNDPKQSKEMDLILRKALDSMIMDILLEQEGVRLKATVSESDVDEELATIMKTNGLTKAQFEQRLAAQKISLKELRDNLRKKIMRQKIMGQEVGRKVVVTNKEIEDYYKAHKNDIFRRDGLHMALLVYPRNVNASSIAAQIASGALPFPDAARKYSVAPNKEKGGDMGPVEWDRLNPEWNERLSKMKPGEVTDIFTINGFKAQVYLFRPGATGPDAPLTLDEARPIIDGILRRPKAMERFEDYTRQLRSRAVIDIRL